MQLFRLGCLAALHDRTSLEPVPRLSWLSGSEDPTILDAAPPLPPSSRKRPKPSAVTRTLEYMRGTRDNRHRWCATHGTGALTLSSVLSKVRDQRRILSGAPLRAYQTAENSRAQAHAESLVADTVRRSGIADMRHAAALDNKIQDATTELAASLFQHSGQIQHSRQGHTSPPKSESCAQETAERAAYAMQECCGYA